MTVRLKSELEIAIKDRDENPIDETNVFVEILNYYFTKFLELSSIEGVNRKTL